jgi:hypothetical protein
MLFLFFPAVYFAPDDEPGKTKVRVPIHILKAAYYPALYTFPQSRFLFAIFYCIHNFSSHFLAEAHIPETKSKKCQSQSDEDYVLHTCLPVKIQPLSTIRSYSRWHKEVIRKALNVRKLDE